MQQYFINPLKINHMKHYSFILEALESDEQAIESISRRQKNNVRNTLSALSAIGALTGGTIGGIRNKRKGKSFWKGAAKGALIGGAVGAAGGIPLSKYTAKRLEGEMERAKQIKQGNDEAERLNDKIASIADKIK